MIAPAAIRRAPQPGQQDRGPGSGRNIRAKVRWLDCAASGQNTVDIHLHLLVNSVAHVLTCLAQAVGS